MRTAFQQNDAQLRFDWGLPGALAMTEPPGTAAVVVDVLSFSTAVSVAADLRISVFPFPWRDDRAAAFAESVGATLAGGRRQRGLSLSPAALRAHGRQPDGHDAYDRQAGEFGRLVLPSPNGSSICYALAERQRPPEPPDQAPLEPMGRERGEPSGRGPTVPSEPVLTGCLRNATAIANWLVRRLTTGQLSAVGVVAAGERWPDGSLRPAIEDLWGAGAILARMASVAPQLRSSPEASAAAAAFAAIEPELAARLAGCASGRELIEDGFAEDVAIAAELDGSARVPMMVGHRFEAVRG